MKIKLIVALDFDHESNALALVDQLNPKLCALKVGSEMFTRFGTSFVKALVARKFKVFLDLKFYDIPNQVAGSCKAAAELGVWMINVHASGGLAMMQAARTALNDYGKNRPLLIAVTVLTSMSQADLIETSIPGTLEQRVNDLARLTQQAALDGVVSSALEVPAIKAMCGDNFLTVTPGIRFADSAKDDQTRIITPQLAIKAGSDYLVVGRPITRAERPDQVVRTILDDIQAPIF